jgi:four helix bundle protein
LGKDYRKIFAWQKCDAFAFAAYQAARGFPREEVFGLTSQLRRAALSAPTNIVEGCGRRTQRDYLLFLNRAETSLEEAGYLLEFAGRLGYLKATQTRQLSALKAEAARVLTGLVAKVAADLGASRRGAEAPP